MKINIVKKYFDLDFKGRTIAASKFTITYSYLLGIFKIIFGIFAGLFFVANGFVNILISTAKLLCLYAIKKKAKAKSKYNVIISLIQFLAGAQYLFCMLILYKNLLLSYYNLYLVVLVIVFSFFELLNAVYGLFRVTFKGHYYKNIKILNLSIALTAISLAVRSFLFFQSHIEALNIAIIFGIIIAIIIMILAVIIFIATWLSIFDSLHHVYKSKTKMIVNEHISIKLHKNYFFGDYTFQAYVSDPYTITGNIIRHRARMFRGSIEHRTILALICFCLSPVYIIGIFVEQIIISKIPKKLDNIMKNKQYIIE